MKYTVITKDPSIIQQCQSYGNFEVLIDLEPGASLLHQFSKEDVSKIREAFPSLPLIVRTTPMPSLQPKELEELVNRGADALMIPSVSSSSALQRMIEHLSEKVRFIAMIEDGAGIVRVRQIAEIPQIAELYFGCHDLCDSLSLHHIFETLTEGIIEFAAIQITVCDKRFGFTGVSPKAPGIPLPLIVGEHVRLGSQRMLIDALSSFVQEQFPTIPGALELLHRFHKDAEKRSPQQTFSDKESLRKFVLS